MKSYFYRLAKQSGARFTQEPSIHVGESPPSPKELGDFVEGWKEENSTNFESREVGIQEKTPEAKAELSASERMINASVEGTMSDSAKDNLMPRNKMENYAKIPCHEEEILPSFPTSNEAMRSEVTVEAERGQTQKDVVERHKIFVAGKEPDKTSTKLNFEEHKVVAVPFEFRSEKEGHSQPIPATLPDIRLFNQKDRNVDAATTVKTGINNQAPIHASENTVPKKKNENVLEKAELFVENVVHEHGDATKPHIFAIKYSETNSMLSKKALPEKTESFLGHPSVLSVKPEVERTDIQEYHLSIGSITVNIEAEGGQKNDAFPIAQVGRRETELSGTRSGGSGEGNLSAFRMSRHYIKVR